MTSRKDVAVETVEVFAAQFGILAPMLIPLVTANPAWIVVFSVFFSVYAGLATYKQQRLNEVAKFIQDHPEQFRTEIIQSEEFKDGFVVFLADYLRSRIERKRQILKSIFMEFTLSEDKEAFELERMNSCLERMSLQSMEFLAFLSKEIIPQLHEKILGQNEDAEHDYTDRSAEWWVNMSLMQESIWQPTHEWLNKRYDPQLPSVKSEYKVPPAEEWPKDKLERATTRDKEERTKVNESILELVTLGIFDKRVSGGGTWGGGAGSDYVLTLFGIRFLKFVNEATGR